MSSSIMGASLAMQLMMPFGHHCLLDVSLCSQSQHVQLHSSAEFLSSVPCIVLCTLAAAMHSKPSAELQAYMLGRACQCQRKADY